MKTLLTFLLSVVLTATSTPGNASGTPVAKARARQSQSLPATPAPIKPTAVRIRTAGRVWEVYVRNGQHVEQGQMLLKMTSDVQTPTHPGYQIDYDIAALQFKQIKEHFKTGKATAAQVEDARFQMKTAKKMLNDGPQQRQFFFVSAPISGVLSGHSVVAGDQLQLNSLVVMITADPLRKAKATRVAVK